MFITHQKNALSFSFLVPKQLHKKLLRFTSKGFFMQVFTNISFSSDERDLSPWHKEYCLEYTT